VPRVQLYVFMQAFPFFLSFDINISVCFTVRESGTICFNVCLIVCSTKRFTVKVSGTVCFAVCSKVGFF